MLKITLIMTFEQSTKLLKIYKDNPRYSCVNFSSISDSILMLGCNIAQRRVSKIQEVTVKICQILKRMLMRGGQSFRKQVSLVREDVDERFLSTTWHSPPPSLFSRFSDRAKLIFQIHKPLRDSTHGFDCEEKSGNFSFHLRHRTLGQAFPVQSPPIRVIVVGLKSTVKSGNSTLNGLCCYKKVCGPLGFIAQQYLGSLSQAEPGLCSA